MRLLCLLSANGSSFAMMWDLIILKTAQAVIRLRVPSFPSPALFLSPFSFQKSYVRASYGTYGAAGTKHKTGICLYRRGVERKQQPQA